MNKYIKPEFMLTSLTGSALSSSNCAITEDDRELLFGGLTNDQIEKFFGREEGCNPWVEEYCKFTSVEKGAGLALFS